MPADFEEFASARRYQVGEGGDRSGKSGGSSFVIDARAEYLYIVISPKTRSVDQRDQPVEPRHAIARHSAARQGAIAGNVIADLNERDVAARAGNRRVDIGIEPAGKNVDSQMDACRTDQRDGVGQPVCNRRIGIKVRGWFQCQLDASKPCPLGTWCDAFGKAVGCLGPCQITPAAGGESDRRCGQAMCHVDRVRQPIARSIAFDVCAIAKCAVR